MFSFFSLPFNLFCRLFRIILRARLFIFLLHVCFPLPSCFCYPVVRLCSFFPHHLSCLRSCDFPSHYSHFFPFVSSPSVVLFHASFPLAFPSSAPRLLPLYYTCRRPVLARTSSGSSSSIGGAWRGCEWRGKSGVE